MDLPAPLGLRRTERARSDFMMVKEINVSKPLAGDSSGFTLIELLVVIAIIAILGVLAAAGLGQGQGARAAGFLH
jgi:prepilin-type N-terminal cleavage/methylation domain-containing protein